MRRKIRCDCTGEPPGELMTIATAGAPFTAKARSSGPASVDSVTPGRRRRHETDRAGDADDGDDGFADAELAGKKAAKAVEHEELRRCGWACRPDPAQGYWSGEARVQDARPPRRLLSARRRHKVPRWARRRGTR